MAVRASQRDTDAGAGVVVNDPQDPALLVMRLHFHAHELRLIIDGLGEMWDHPPDLEPQDGTWDALHGLLHRMEAAYATLYRAQRARVRR